VTLDGGLSGELELRGHDVSSALWSARLLRDDPDAVVDVHRAYLAAGARVVTTASYQATFEGFARAGIALDEARLLMQRSVELARRAQEESRLLDGVTRPTWVAASAGPYGAMLADGSEYTGAYTRLFWTGRAGGGLTARDLRAFHRPRLEALAEAGPDVLACETVPCLVEAEALVAELDALGHPGWLSLTTVTTPDGEVRTRRDEPAAEAFAMARDSAAVVAVGVNCIDPRGTEAAVRLAAEVSGKPVVVYPNSGELWDAEARSWHGDALDVAGQAARWVAAGARLVGGCCRIGPDAIGAVARQLDATAGARGSGGAGGATA
jgi:homocysteine S-methyltransferase